MVTELTNDTFAGFVENNDIAIIDFWAPWCGPCRSFAPIFEQAAAANKDIAFAKVNTEEQQELAAQFQLRSIPTMMVLREQIIVFSQPGALPGNALDQLIGQVKALDMDKVRREIAEQKQAGAQPAD